MMHSAAQPVFFLLQEHTATNQSLWETLVQSNFLNFLIAAIVLLWVIKRFRLLSILDKRQADVIQKLRDAEDKRAKALQELEEIEKRMLKLTQEVDSILKEAHQTAEMVAKTVIEGAEEEADKILSNAQRRVELEERTAARELEQRLIREAIHGARQLLESSLTVEDKQRSVDDFITALPELYRKELSR